MSICDKCKSKGHCPVGVPPENVVMDKACMERQCARNRARMEHETYGSSPAQSAIEDVKRFNKMDEAARVAGCAAFFREKNNEQT